jgi:hypothetical protein
MKLIISIFILSLSNLFAWGYFPMNPRFQVTPFQVSAQFYNPYYEPIACSGYVYGLTTTGQTMTTFFNDPFIPAGQFRMAFVRTIPRFPFINAWAQVNCHFLR